MKQLVWPIIDYGRAPDRFSGSVESSLFNVSPGH